jgi:hypothetical protein
MKEALELVSIQNRGFPFQGTMRESGVGVGCIPTPSSCISRTTSSSSTEARETLLLAEQDLGDQVDQSRCQTIPLIHKHCMPLIREAVLGTL